MFLWSGEDGKVKSYSATTKGDTSILRVEFEIRDPWRLANLLASLAEQVAEGRKKPARGKTRPEPLALPLYREAGS